jgi:hypothetical protein
VASAPINIFASASVNTSHAVTRASDRAPETAAETLALDEAIKLQPPPADTPTTNATAARPTPTRATRTHTQLPLDRMIDLQRIGPSFIEHPSTPDTTTSRRPPPQALVQPTVISSPISCPRSPLLVHTGVTPNHSRAETSTPPRPSSHGTRTPTDTQRASIATHRTPERLDMHCMTSRSDALPLAALIRRVGSGSR